MYLQFDDHLRGSITIFQNLKTSHNLKFILEIEDVFEIFCYRCIDCV